MTSVPHSHVEIERSFETPEGTPVPNLTDVAGIASVEVEPTMHLQATYYDTADLVLTRSRTTLRQRTGGKDDGWHLKLPASPDDSGEERRELQAPPADSLPQSIEDEVGLITTEPLVPLVQVNNDRTTHVLRDEQGRVLAELCDDHVTTRGLREGMPEQAWTEWEVELVESDLEFLDAVEVALAEVGATRLQLASKLVRALGPMAKSAHKA